MDDPIEKLLSSTGWSCDELLQRLQSYKQKGTEKVENVPSASDEKKKIEENEAQTIELTKEPAIDPDNSKSDRVSKEAILPYPKRKFPLEEEEIQNVAVISDSEDESTSDCAKKLKMKEVSLLQPEIQQKSDLQSEKKPVNESEELDQSKANESLLKCKNNEIEQVSTCNEKVIDSNIKKSTSEEENVFETNKSVFKDLKTNKDVSIENLENKENHSDDFTEKSETIKQLDQSESQENSPQCSINSSKSHNSNSDQSKSFSLIEIKKLTTEFLARESQVSKNCDESISKPNLETNSLNKSSVSDKIATELVSDGTSLLKPSTSKKVNEPSDFSSTQEEIRNKVKMQLCNLRRRRKISLIDKVNSAINESRPGLDDKKDKDLKNATVIEKCELSNLDNTSPSKIKVRDFCKTDNGEINLPNLLTSSPTMPKLVPISRDKPKTIILSRKSVDDGSMPNKSDFLTESNGLGIVILNVQGGVQDIEDKNNESDVEVCVDDDEPYNAKALINQHKEKNVTHETIDCALDQLRKIINKKGEKKNTKVFKSDSRPNKPKVVSTPISSNENSNSSCMDIGKSSEEKQRSEEANKSAFLSNSLDEFLTENAKLNISYNVPKLGAEEALKRTRAGTPPALRAEFNRELKKSESQSEEKNFKQYKSNISNIKAKTLAEKRKLLEQIGGYETPEGLLLRKRQFLPSKESNRSYIWYKGKKIFLRSALSNVCMGQFMDKPVKRKTNIRKPSVTIESKSPEQAHKKLSLLKEFVQTKPKLRYKPGPLSKKSSQFKNNGNWDFSLKTLPQVCLEIEPEINKSIPSHILSYLPKNDGSLTSAQIEFALSMLPQKDEKTAVNLFKFPIKYKHNQSKILVRKRKLAPTKIIPVSPSEKKPVNRDDVASVIDDLIKYVEIKEIGDSIIKEDDDLVVKEMEAERQVSPIKSKISEKVSTIVKKTGRSRVAMELARLSCKFINVTVDNGADEEDEKDCGNLHCKMGCVCQKKPYTPKHCGKIECMFDCTCPVDKIIKDNQDITLPPGTDLLSAATVNHLQDVAKKDLAKVEKDFTQTVITAPDKTIVLGLNGGKPRRETKPPVKYTSDLTKYKNQRSRVREVFTEKEEKKQLQHIRKYRCFVSLPKIIVTHIIPYCMVHEQLNCECKGLANFPDPPKMVQTEIKPQYLNSTVKENELKTNTKMFGNKRENSFGVKSQMTSEESCDAIIIDDDIDDFLSPETDPLSNSKQLSKRKQSFNEIRTEEMLNQTLKTFNTDQAIQRRQSKSILVNTDKSVNTVFEGEIIIDLRNMELLKDLGLKVTDARCARLLSWDNLLKNYQSKKIKIWCHVKQPSRLLINTSDKHPPKFYIEIDQSTNKESDVLTWIKTGQLPCTHNKSNFYFIIKPTKNHYEICGICTRNISQKPATVSSEENRVKEKIQLACLNNTSLKIFKRLDVGDPNDFKCDDWHYVKLPGSPTGQTNGRWRTFYVFEVFSYLKLERNGYCIKYSDIRQVQKKAHTLQKTIVFRSPELYRGYNQHQFGIYCDYKYDKFVFVGPYGMNEEPNVKAYKTDGGAKIFEVKNAFWIVQATDSELINIQSLSAEERKRKLLFDRASKISILKRPNPLALSKFAESAKKPKIETKTTSNELLMPNGKQVLLVQSKPRAPENYNRFIVTNVPTFGYLGAVQHPTFDVIDVSWPNENKYLRFADEEAAVEFLKQRFQDIFLTVPDDFEMKFMVVTDVDLLALQPFDVKYLKGHYICGSFGIFDLKTLSDEDAINKTGISKEMLLKSYNEKMHKLISNHLTELERVLELSAENEKMISLNIFEKAVKQIRHLEEKQRELLAEKDKLNDNKKDLNKKIESLVAKLHGDKTLIRERLSIDTKPVETIEILDDDDVPQQSETQTLESKELVQPKDIKSYAQIPITSSLETQRAGFVPIYIITTNIFESYIYTTFFQHRFKNNSIE